MTSYAPKSCLGILNKKGLYCQSWISECVASSAS